MASLKDIRIRITSVNSTMQITSAMKMVSAAKLRRAQDAITQMRPYAEKLQEILVNVSASLGDNTEGSNYGKQREVKRVLLIAVTSNRGLCGGFNNNVIKQAKALMSTAYAGKEVKVLSIGKKASDVFKKTPNYYTKGFGDTPYAIYDDLKFADVAEIAEKVMAQFADGSFDRVDVIYNKFKNAASQELTSEQFLPVVPPAEGGTSKAEYIFEPDMETIVKDMVPKSLKAQLFKAILDSVASEHGARMTAMHKATDNASDLKKELKLYYNKARQASITNEILEIVGGAEALNG